MVSASETEIGSHEYLQGIQIKAINNNEARNALIRDGGNIAI